MRKRLLVAVFSLLVGFGALAQSAEDYWPMWRGPIGNGVAVKGNPPTEIGPDKNLKWKVELPDAGDCTPIVWGDRIYIQYAVATKEDTEAKVPSREEQEVLGREIFTPIPTVPYVFGVMCLDRATGETIWKTDLLETIPHEGHHMSSSFASYSPVTDGKHLWVNFGSRGLHCLTVDGECVWSADLIEMLTIRAFGEGSSPAVTGDGVYVVCDHEGQSKIFAFNKLTGEKLWEKDRDEPSSWATPFPVEVNGKTQLVTSGSTAVRAYDPENGDIIWQCSGLHPGALPSPVIGDGMAFFMTGFQNYALLAIELGGTGDLTGTDAVKWTLDENTPYVPSPMLYGDRLYFTSGMRAALSCYDAKTGKPHYETERLDGVKQLYSSPTGANGHVYIAGRKGGVIVLKDSDTYEVVSTASFDEGFDASPVVVGDELFLRGEKHLYCFTNQ